MVHPRTEVLADNLRRLRAAHGLSLGDLSEATGIGKATLSAIENGQGNPRFDTLVAIARALSVEVGELADPPPYEEVRVVLPADAPRETAAGGATAHVLERTNWMEILHLDVPAGREGELPGVGGAMRAAYVLEGKLETGPVERPTEVAAGTYVGFPGDTATLLRTGRRSARLLLIDLRV